MYTPKSFEIGDPETIAQFVRANGFGILVTTQDGEIESTHTPMFLSSDRTQVLGHIAKANQQWKNWSSHPRAKLIFHGAHTYISPTDYVSTGNVPTWNYTAVTIRGRLELLESVDEKLRVVEHLVETYESANQPPWRLDTTDKKRMNLLEGIVCFAVRVEAMQAKFKLSQNKSIEDRRNVIERLRQRGGEMNVQVAELMQDELRDSSHTS